MATGSMPTIECVHISWRSMVSTIAGPSMWRMNCGRASVSTEPSAAPASEMNERQQHVADLALHDGRIVVAQKVENLPEAFAPAGINDMVGASQ